MIALNQYYKLESGETFEEIRKYRVEKSVQISHATADAKSFQEIFGDLSNCVFVGSLDLSNLNLNSLEGCPQCVSESLVLDQNPNLTSLKHGPKEIMRSVPEDQFPLFSASYTGLENLEYFPEKIPKNLVLKIQDTPISTLSHADPTLLATCSEFWFFGSPNLSLEEIFQATHLQRSYTGSFSFVFSQFKRSDLEKLYNSPKL